MKNFQFDIDDPVFGMTLHFRQSKTLPVTDEEAARGAKYVSTTALMYHLKLNGIGMYTTLQGHFFNFLYFLELDQTLIRL